MRSSRKGIRAVHTLFSVTQRGAAGSFTHARLQCYEQVCSRVSSQISCGVSSGGRSGLTTAPCAASAMLLRLMLLHVFGGYQAALVELQETRVRGITPLALLGKRTIGRCLGSLSSPEPYWVVELTVLRGTRRGKWFVF